MEDEIEIKEQEYHKIKRTLKLKNTNRILDLDKLKYNKVQIKINNETLPFNFVLAFMECEYDSEYPAGYKINLEFKGA